MGYLLFFVGLPILFIIITFIISKYIEKEEITVRQFLWVVFYLFIPVFNFFMLSLLLFYDTKLTEKWKSFLDKKLW